MSALVLCFGIFSLSKISFADFINDTILSFVNDGSDETFGQAYVDFPPLDTFTLLPTSIEDDHFVDIEPLYKTMGHTTAFALASAGSATVYIVSPEGTLLDTLTSEVGGKLSDVHRLDHSFRDSQFYVYGSTVNGHIVNFTTGTIVTPADLSAAGAGPARSIAVIDFLPPNRTNIGGLTPVNGDIIAFTWGAARVGLTQPATGNTIADYGTLGTEGEPCVLCDDGGLAYNPFNGTIYGTVAPDGTNITRVRKITIPGGNAFTVFNSGDAFTVPGHFPVTLGQFGDIDFLTETSDENDTMFSGLLVFATATGEATATDNRFIAITDSSGVEKDLRDGFLGGGPEPGLAPFQFGIAVGPAPVPELPSGFIGIFGLVLSGVILRFRKIFQKC